jgi:hypothetical protein
VSDNPIRLKVPCPVACSEQSVYIYWLKDSSGSVSFFFNGCDFMSACAACSQCEQDSLNLIRSAPSEYPPTSPADMPKS